MILSDREKQVLLTMKLDSLNAINRKRSWRPSEKALAMAEVVNFYEKLLSPAVSDVDNDSAVSSRDGEDTEGESSTNA